MESSQIVALLYMTKTRMPTFDWCINYSCFKNEKNVNECAYCSLINYIGAYYTCWHSRRCHIVCRGIYSKLHEERRNVDASMGWIQNIRNMPHGMRADYYRHHL